MTTKKVLLAGESWVSAATHYKGFDQFGSVTFHLGAEPLVKALEGSPFDLTYMPAHEAATAFPLTLEGLQAYDAIILSDLGANTLLLHPDVWLHGKTVPNRLKLLHDYVAAGGGLAMIGGYFSFQGINGAARWHKTPVEATLPVRCLPYDDRVEVPEGFAAELVQPAHPILSGLDAPWPVLLGLNEVVLAPGAELLARAPDAAGGHPLLAVTHFGQGRTLAWTSDIGPHWLPQPFVDWPGYARLWRQSLHWLCRGD
ncbi:MAG: cytoplasmic protein [Geminicoccaceae bacterium]|nr:MAG: cytoplasmic protein [Geminicoccaceae bacterium]